MSDLSRLYLDAIRQHASDPTGYRDEIGATHQHEEYNPLCGDRILLQLRISRGQVDAAAFDGEACAICMASASLLCESVPGKPLEHLQALHDKLQAALESDTEPEGMRELRPLLGVRPYPSRIRCATLPWAAALKAL